MTCLLSPPMQRRYRSCISPMATQGSTPWRRDLHFATQVIATRDYAAACTGCCAGARANGLRVVTQADWTAGIMKRFLLLILTTLMLTACGSTKTPDVKTIVQVTAVATPTARPTDTPTPTPNVTSTPPGIPARAPTGEPILAFPPAPKLSPFTISLATYKGQGFSFKYPANARVENAAPVSPAIDEIPLVGPLVWVRPGDADWFYNGPAYELTIRTYRNPDGLDVESWTRNYILTSWQKARDQGMPWGALPVSENGTIEESRVGSLIVGGQSAFWVNYFAFDSDLLAFYLSSDSRIIELDFYDYPLENQPLATIQQDIYALIIGTFHLEINK